MIFMISTARNNSCACEHFVLIARIRWKYSVILDLYENNEDADTLLSIGISVGRILGP